MKNEIHKSIASIFGEGGRPKNSQREINPPHSRGL